MNIQKKPSHHKSNLKICTVRCKGSTALVMLCFMSPMIFSPALVWGMEDDGFYSCTITKTISVPNEDKSAQHNDIEQLEYKGNLRFLKKIQGGYNIPLEATKFVKKKLRKTVTKAVNSYKIDVNAASFSTREEGRYDFYDIELTFAATPAQELYENRVLPGGYKLIIKPIAKDNRIIENDLLDVWKECPKTAVRESKYTETIEFSLGTNIGASTIGTGSVGANTLFRISEQYSRDISDGSITHRTNDNKMQWNIQYNNLHLNQWNKEKGFCPKDTIKHRLRWIWRIEHNDAKEQLYNDLDNKLIFSFEIELFPIFVFMKKGTSHKVKKRSNPLLALTSEIIQLKVPLNDNWTIKDNGDNKKIYYNN